MPPQPSYPRVAADVRAYLSKAKESLPEEMPLDKRNIAREVNTSPGTLYKCLRLDPRLSRLVEDARKEQARYAQLSDRGRSRKDYARIVQELRLELENAKEGNRRLLVLVHQIRANLLADGVSAQIIERAWTTPLDKPNRSVSGAGRGRRRRRPLRIIP